MVQARPRLRGSHNLPYCREARSLPSRFSNKARSCKPALQGCKLLPTAAETLPKRASSRLLIAIQPYSQFGSYYVLRAITCIPQKVEGQCSKTSLGKDSDLSCLQ